MKSIPCFIAFLAWAAGLHAQQAAQVVAAERAAFAEWLTTSGNSPYAVVVQQHIGAGLTLGPRDADVPLEGLTLHRLVEREGVPRVIHNNRERVLPRFLPVPLAGDYRVAIVGRPGQGVAVVYRAAPLAPKAPEYYPYQPILALTVNLQPDRRMGTRRILAADGVDVEATEMGTVLVTIGGRTTALQVMRVPDATGEEAELEIYFRDGTNGKTTYPAGRFVTLDPLGGTRYRLDFNRARNPFCAYSSAYACPIPWRGNLIEAPIEAGERYSGGGLELKPTGEP